MNKIHPNFYKKYIQMFKHNEFETGFSYRIPDYGIRFWLSVLEHAVNFEPNKIFFDIGAGNGRLSVFLAQNFFKNCFAIEVDVNKNIWDKILQKNKNIKLIEGLFQESIHKIPKNCKADFVLLAEVFEHIPPDAVDKFIDALKKIMKPGGRLFLTTPNIVVQGHAKNSPRWYQVQKHGHHKHYSLKELITIFENKNFEIKWHKFESETFKRKVYNKLFYPFCRLDQKLLVSTKMPKILQTFYRYTSYPFIQLVRFLFFILSQLIYFAEKYLNSEKKSETIMVLFSLKKG